jgi:hypothetical protein
VTSPPPNKNTILTALRQIEAALSREENPTLRACGLTEETVKLLTDQSLVNLFFVADNGPLLDNYRVGSISPAGLGILAQSDMVPLAVSLVSPHESFWKRARKKVGGWVWDLVKVASGVVLGWYLKKHFP